MIQTVIAASALGFLGSLHCLGMCGPIALALPVEPESGRARFLLGRGLYNLGRVLTYAVMGAIMGSLGQAISLLGWQQGLSLAAGSAILLGLLVPKRHWLRLTRFHLVARAVSHFKRAWARRFGVGTPTSLFVIGLLNGLLPCGLVYVALAGAAATGTIYGGILFMSIFGLGTAPAMFATATLGKLVDQGGRRLVRRVAPAMIGIMAVLFILRGLALGIPHLSPRVNPEADTAHATHGQIETTGEQPLPSCCQPNAE